MNQSNSYKVINNSSNSTINANNNVNNNNKSKGMQSVINNNVNINSISLTSITKKAEAIASPINNTANLIISNSNNNNNNRYQLSSTSSTSQLQNQTNFGNYILTSSAFDNSNNNPSDILQINQQKKLSARLTDVQKNENINNSVLNNYRVRSAQNVAKQRATGTLK